MPGRIPTIDAFAGIGGFSYALSGVCKTIMYCENDEAACKVLMSNMARNNLDKAPIHHDIKTLQPASSNIKNL